jgi:hypothetical protein
VAIASGDMAAASSALRRAELDPMLLMLVT